MKKTINLLSEGEGWKTFEYENIEELKDELKARNISIGSHTSIGYDTSIGYGTSIGSHTSIGSFTSIGYGTSIGDGTFIGSHTSIGYGTSIGDGTFISSHTSIGYGTSIGDGLIIKAISITGSKHLVSYWGQDCILIGCVKKSIIEWKEQYKEVGETERYTSEQIKEYGGYIEMISGFHDIKMFEPIQRVISEKEVIA